MRNRSINSCLAFFLGCVSGYACEISIGDPGIVAVPYAITALGCNAANTYRWDFGDGTGETPFAPDTSVHHIFTAPENYTIKLTIRDGNGNESIRLEQLNVVAPPTGISPKHTSTIILDKAQGLVWMVNPDNNSITAIGDSLYQRAFEIPVGKNPRTLALGPSGEIWVVNGGDASISIVDKAKGILVSSINLPYASMPFGIVFNHELTRAFVTLEATGTLVEVNTATRSIARTLAVFPSPRAMALSGDGKRLYVTRWISPKDHAEVAKISTGGLALDKVIRLALDSTSDDTKSSCRGVLNGLNSIIISPDGQRAYVPSIKDNILRGLARDGNTPTFETTVRSMVSVLDLDKDEELFGSRIDLDDENLPSAVDFDRFGTRLFISLLASNAVSVIDPQGKRIARMYSNTDGGLPAVNQLGNIGVVADPDAKKAFVNYLTTRDAAVYDISRLNTANAFARLAVVGKIAHETMPPGVLRGKQIFYNSSDTRMALDHYMSCVVCHLDGSTDGRVWDFTDRGEGLRSTQSLLGRAGTGNGPLHHTANFDEVQDFEHDIRGPNSGSGFLTDAQFAAAATPLGKPKAGMSPDLDALAEYVSSLQSVNPSPFRKEDGSLTEAGLRGKAIFERVETGCAICHPAPQYTLSSLKGTEVTPPFGTKSVTAEGFALFDVGTLKATSGKRLGDTLTGLDIPTLKGIWQTAPYLHDGSAPTLMDVITTANPQDKHGATSHLTSAEKEDLIAFLKQIDDTETQANGTHSETKPMASRLTWRKSGLGYEFFLSAESAPDCTLTLFGYNGKKMVSVPFIQYNDSFSAQITLSQSSAARPYILHVSDARKNLIQAGIFFPRL